MREILFRGANNDNRWFYGYINQYIADDVTIDSWNETISSGDFYIHDCYEGAIHKVFQNSVGQYTGFEDRNGEKIFEGDILKISSQTNGSFLSIVIFDSDSFKVNILCLHNEFLSSQVLNLSTIFNEKFSVKIIGNIFDNDIKRLLNEVK